MDRVEVGILGVGAIVIGAFVWLMAFSPEAKAAHERDNRIEATETAAAQGDYQFFAKAKIVEMR